MGRQVYLSGINYKKIADSRIEIIDIINNPIAKTYGNQASKIDIAKLNNPSSFTVEEFASLINVLELYYDQLSPDNCYNQSLTKIGITETFSTSTTSESDLFMYAFISLFPNLPNRYEESIYYPLSKNDLLKVLRKMNANIFLQRLIHKIDSSDEDVYLLFDSY